jgi:hypothetical protein
LRWVLALLPLLAGCTVAQVSVGVGGAACPDGARPAAIAEAIFGRSHAGREVVDDIAWARFLEEVVTPAFPDGLTVLDGAGQWLGRDGRIARERSKILLVALPDSSLQEASSRLAPVIASYRARFAQESVMVATRSGCIAF